MQTTLCVNILSSNANKEDILFFSSSEWNADTERQLLDKLKEVLIATQNLVSSIELVIKIETKNPNLLRFSMDRVAIQKKQEQPIKLTIREIEVLGLIMQGFTNSEISEKLFICFETVKSHRKNILEKTGAKNTVALINYYRQTFLDKE